jgi:beta-glucosidase
VTTPVGRSSRLDIETTQADEPKAIVTVGAPVYPVDAGGTVDVRLTVATLDGTPLEAPVTLTFQTGHGTASEQVHYTPAQGTVTLPAGTPSGAAHTFTVTTVATGEPSVALTIPVEISADGAMVAGDAPAVVINAHGLPYLDPARPVAERVADLLGRMTLDEKIGQMTQAERNALVREDDIATVRLGSLLSGGGSVPTPNTPVAWADMIDRFQLRARATRLQIPLIYGVDAVHGHNNVVGATIFPHHIALGASRRTDLVRRLARLTAVEVRATGIPWDFTPCLGVVRDERWGRVYESFGEDPALVTRMAQMVDALQTDLTSPESVLATAKHYVGDGGTTYGSSTTNNYLSDQGTFIGTTEEFRAVHLAPFAEAVRQGLGCVMLSYNRVDYTDRPDEEALRMHGHHELVTEVLKGEFGFDGFVVSDWKAIDQLSDDYPTAVRLSINAGLDMVMVPALYHDFVAALRGEVEAGRVPLSRVDDAVARILGQKFRLGLFERPYADRTHLDTIGSAEHRALAREAAAASQVLLKNAGGVLPLRPDARIYVAGSNADDLGHQLGGWSVTWQGGSGDTTTGTTILAGMREVAPQAQITYSADASASTAGFDVGVVVVGETPYAEGYGDIGYKERTLQLSDVDRKAIEQVSAAMPCVVVVVSGRPLQLADQLDAMSALVAAWLPGTEGAGVAEPLFGRRPYTGRLPVTWVRDEAQLPMNVGDADYAPLFPYGFGLRTDAPADRLQGLDPALLNHRPALCAAIEQALPGLDFEQADTLISLMRDGVDDPSRLARADQQVAAGNYREALSILSQ